MQACFTPQGLSKMLEILPRKSETTKSDDCDYEPNSDDGCPKLDMGKVEGSSQYAIGTSKTTAQWVNLWGSDADKYVSEGPCLQLADSADEFIVHVLESWDAAGEKLIPLVTQGSRGTPLRYGGRFRLQSVCTGEYLTIEKPASVTPSTTTWDVANNMLVTTATTPSDLNDVTFLIKNPEDIADTGTVKGSSGMHVCIAPNHCMQQVLA